MRIQFTQSDTTKHHLNQPNVTACYLARDNDPDSQLFVSLPDERIIFEVIGYDGNSLGYVGQNGLTKFKSEAVVQLGDRNVILHDCNHVEWIRRVTLH